MEPGSVRFSTLFSLLFIYWLGVGVVRATPLIPVVTCPLLLVEYRRTELLTKVEAWRSEITSLVWAVLLGLLVVILLWGLGPELVPESIGKSLESAIGGDLRLGKSPYYSREWPEYVLKRFPNRRTYTSGDIGSYVLWVWWPWKKVFMQTKYSAYDRTVLKQISTVRGVIQALDRYDVDVSIISRPNHAGGK